MRKEWLDVATGIHSERQAMSRRYRRPDQWRTRLSCMVHRSRRIWLDYPRFDAVLDAEKVRR